MLPNQETRPKDTEDVSSRKIFIGGVIEAAVTLEKADVIPLPVYTMTAVGEDAILRRVSYIFYSITHY